MYVESIYREKLSKSVCQGGQNVMGDEHQENELNSKLKNYKELWIGLHFMWTENLNINYNRRK